MTPKNKLFYKYVEARIVAKNYKEALQRNINRFFKNKNVDAFLIESSDCSKYMLIQVLTEIDTDILEEIAIDFAKEFNVVFIRLTKELSAHYEDNRKYEAGVNEYRLLFKRKRMVE